MAAGAARKTKTPPAKPEQLGEGNFRLEGIQLSRLSESLKLPVLSPLRGQLDLTLTFRHEGFNRIPTGTGRVTLSQLRWGAEGEAENLRGEVRLTADAVRIDNLSGNLAGGTVDGRVQWNYRRTDRSFFVLTFGRVDSAKLLAPFPSLDGRIQAPLDMQIRGSLGRAWSGTGQIAFGRGKVFGLSLTDVRLPLEWRLAPRSGDGEVVIRDASGHAANGQASPTSGAA